MTQRRIAIVGPVFPYRTGIAYCTSRLAEELAKEDHVQVISFSRQFPAFLYPGSSDRDPVLASKTPHPTRFTLDIVNPFSWFREALRIRRENYDAVILVWWIWVWAIPYRVLAALLPTKTRVLLQCHNATDKEPAFWKSFLNRWLFRRADDIIVHAGIEAAAIERQTAGAARVHRAFLPVHEMGSPPPPRDAAKSDLGVDGDVALFFGHVRPFKGLDIAIDAWSRMSQPATLLVAGEVWWSDGDRYREQAASLGLGERVRFDFRFIPDSEIATWFAASDVVVVPYRHESQSGVALTAFHFERPVIATRVGGLPEVIRDGIEGFLVEPENPAALATALDRFFSDTEARARMEKGSREAAAKYSWAAYGSILRAVLAGQTPARL